MACSGPLRLYYYNTEIPEYEYEEIEISFVPEKYFSGVDKPKDITEAIEEFNPIGLIYILVGKPFREYMEEVDTNNILGKVLFWAYFITFLFLFVNSYFMTRSVDIIFPIIASSIIMIIVSLIAGEFGVLAVSLIILAFGVGIPFATRIGGGSNGK